MLYVILSRWSFTTQHFLLPFTNSLMKTKPKLIVSKVNQRIIFLLYSSIVHQSIFEYCNSVVILFLNQLSHTRLTWCPSDWWRTIWIEFILGFPKVHMNSELHMYTSVRSVDYMQVQQDSICIVASPSVHIPDTR